MTNKNWICNDCSEEVEEQFDTCWNCGYSFDKNYIESEQSKEKFQTKKNEIEDSDSIEKFNSLKTYGGLLSIGLLISVVSMLFGVMFLISKIDNIGIDNISFFKFMSLGIFVIVGLLYIFILYCQTLIIDFLFYLDNKIRDKNYK